MLREMLGRNRSYRRFVENEKVGEETLRDLVDMTRLCASAANLQPLRYVLSYTPERNAKIFECLAWAGYLEDWDAPIEGEKPPAYIIILCDREIAKTPGCDQGIAAQTILLGAVEKGLAGCMLGAVNRNKMHELLDIPDRYEICLVLAIGKPAEEVAIEKAKNGNIRYWRDKSGVHHVPKRPLGELLYTPGE